MIPRNIQNNAINHLTVKSKDSKVLFVYIVKIIMWHKIIIRNTCLTSAPHESVTVSLNLFTLRLIEKVLEHSFN